MPSAAQLALSALAGPSISNNAAADAGAVLMTDTGFMAGDWQVSTKAPRGLQSLVPYVPLAVAVAGLVALAWALKRGAR